MGCRRYDEDEKPFHVCRTPLESNKKKRETIWLATVSYSYMEAYYGLRHTDEVIGAFKTEKNAKLAFKKWIKEHDKKSAILYLHEYALRA